MSKKCLFLACFFLLPFAGCVANDAVYTEQGAAHVHAAPDSFKPHYTDSHFQITDNELYSVELLFKGGNLSVGMNAADLIIHRDTAANPDVEKAAITVTPWMPMHGHGVQTLPTITERGAGLYSVDNIEIVMAGDWQLKVAVDGVSGKDTATFDFPGVEKTGSFGGASHSMQMEMADEMTAPKGTDLASTQQSVRKLYTVSYSSKDAVLPLNRIHSWELTVRDAEDNPVSGMEIEVDGDMPAHGHGLPTKPVVSRETSPGVYLVEGMKFSMPGWWKIVFYLKKGNETDSVAFNLQLR